MNSPTDFSVIMDAIKIIPVIKYLAALKSSEGFLRASSGCLQPKALGGFQGAHLQCGANANGPAVPFASPAAKFHLRNHRASLGSRLR